jgi:hypothetical protein
MELRGQRIPGSKYFRDFCGRCGAPTRVTQNRIGDGMWCEDCEPPFIRCKPATADDDNPWQQIAIRHLEDG